MDTDQPDAAFVRLDSEPGTVTATMVGPSIRDREASIISGEVIAAMKDAGADLRRLVLVMTAIEFMPSMGVGMCVDLRNRAHAAGARTIIVGLHPNLRQIFTIMKLEPLFEIVDDAKKLKKILAS
ncbi:MAG: STAS domain-containing protein [Planctomycetota bacterium]|jgi:anti-anti-sigma factor